MEEQELEDRYIADDSYFEHLVTIEEELIDAYVAGQLSRDERRDFEQHFLSSPQRRQRIEFARALIVKAAEKGAAIPPVVSTVEQQSRSRTWPAFWRMPQPVPQFLALAALVVLALGSWSLLQTYQLRNQLAAVHAEEAALQSEGQELRSRLEQQRTLAQQLNESLEQERNARSGLEQRLQQAAQPLAVASFVLTPGTVRGEERTSLRIGAVKSDRPVGQRLDRAHYFAETASVKVNRLRLSLRLSHS